MCLFLWHNFVLKSVEPVITQCLLKKKMLKLLCFFMKCNNQLDKMYVRGILDISVGNQSL